MKWFFIGYAKHVWVYFRTTGAQSINQLEGPSGLYDSISVFIAYLPPLFRKCAKPGLAQFKDTFFKGSISWVDSVNRIVLIAEIASGRRMCSLALPWNYHSFAGICLICAINISFVLFSTMDNDNVIHGST